MGYSKAQKEKTHKRIVAIASKRFREKGLAGFGIAELMKEAGLTVGGFCKHFDSRDELVAEAVSRCIRYLAAPKRSCGIRRAATILREAYRRLLERCAPKESGYGLYFQPAGAGDRSRQ
jgi:AcrR family transcriptional regulator